MATEIRQIVFKQTEVCAAINDYRRRRGEPLPIGTIDGITFSEGPEVTATLTIKNNAGDKIAVTLSREAVAAALISVLHQPQRSRCRPRGKRSCKRSATALAC